MKFLQIFLSLLPTLITAVEQVSAHLAGHEKKAAVQDALTAVAAGVGVALPEHAQAAHDAATVAVTSIDGVVKVLNDVGVLAPHKAATFASIPAAISFQGATPEPCLAPAVTAPASAPGELTGPGVHTLAPQ